MKRWGLLGVVVLLLAGCGSGKAAGSHTLAGGVFLTGLQSAIGSANGTACTSPADFSDIAAGAAVTVSDQSGTILGLGQLDPGMVTASEECEFLFTIPDIPSKPFYQVQVGHRGEMTYSASQLAANAWVIGFSLPVNS